jgi:hypothetical protein
MVQIDTDPSALRRPAIEGAGGEAGGGDARLAVESAGACGQQTAHSPLDKRADDWGPETAALAFVHTSHSHNCCYGFAFSEPEPEPEPERSQSQGSSN